MVVSLFLIVSTACKSDEPKIDEQTFLQETIKTDKENHAAYEPTEFTDLVKAELKVELYGENREETLENREDLALLQEILSHATYEERSYDENYDGNLKLTKQDGSVLEIQIRSLDGKIELGNTSCYSLSPEEADKLWSVFSRIAGFKKYGKQIWMEMNQDSFTASDEGLSFTLYNHTKKPIQYILSPIIEKKQKEGENGIEEWKQVKDIQGFCGFLTSMSEEEKTLEIPWRDSFELEGEGTYRLSIQVMPEPDLRYEIFDTFELNQE